jgi:hypothetical protein
VAVDPILIRGRTRNGELQNSSRDLAETSLNRRVVTYYVTNSRTLSWGYWRACNVIRYLMGSSFSILVLDGAVWGCGWLGR